MRRRLLALDDEVRSNSLSRPLTEVVSVVAARQSAAARAVVAARKHMAEHDK